MYKKCVHIAKAKLTDQKEDFEEINNGLRFEYLPIRNISFDLLSLTLLLAMITGPVLLPRSIFAQVSPNNLFFEITGDYGDDYLSDLNKERLSSDDLIALDVIRRDGSMTWGRRNGPCSNWAYTNDAPYSGNKSYRVQCEGVEYSRSEQMLLGSWQASSTGNTRYFSMAFRLKDLPKHDTGGFVAQLHQGLGRPAFNVNWFYRVPPGSNLGRYFLGMSVRYDSLHHTEDGVYTDTTSESFGPLLWTIGRKTYKGIPVSLNAWNRILLAISIYPHRPTLPCPGSADITAYYMNNKTGEWTDFGSYLGPFGYTIETDCSFEWKVGLYSNPPDRITIDYDNVAYGKSWNHITKNQLTGYHKTVLALPFDEGRGGVVGDYSYRMNNGRRGDPVSDYQNPGIINTNVNNPWINDGVKGKGIHFNGITHVIVPMDKTDFDFGNYFTVSLWFRTAESLTGKKGLFVIDDNADRSKLLLDISDNNLSFGVKHLYPSRLNTFYSKVQYDFPTSRMYADGRWHHVVGTFNRFAADKRRVKLYIDGQRVNQKEGFDLPIIRGESRLVVGRFTSIGLFKGDVDEVIVRNYAMTDAEVLELYNSYR